MPARAACSWIASIAFRTPWRLAGDNARVFASFIRFRQPVAKLVMADSGWLSSCDSVDAISPIVARRAPDSSFSC